MIWLIVFAHLAAAYGPARAAAHHSALTPKTALTLALIAPFCLGGISLVILWLGLLGIPFAPAVVAALYAALMLPGWWLARRVLPLPRPRLAPGWWCAAALLLAICAAVALNATLWPFYRADALGIYVPFAEALAGSRALIPITPQNQLYELYPQLMSSVYAHVYGLAGWANPYPARLLNAALSLSVLPAVYVLARETLPRRPLAAAAAVALLALTPDVPNWAHAGYVDLPMAAYYTLGAAFAAAGVRGGHWADLALAGLCFGLAAWTKNAALLSVALFLIFLLAGLTQKQLTFNRLLLSCWTVAVVAAPWYLRNLILAGTLTPDTVWVNEARQTLAEVFILISRPQNYGLPGLVMLVGVGWAALRPAGRVLLWWSAPYYLMWLAVASYDPRFLLLFLPFLAVAGGGLLSDGWTLARLQLQPPVRPVALGTLALLAVLSAGVIWNSVEYKRELLANPAMTHAQKMEVVRDPG